MAPHFGAPLKGLAFRAGDLMSRGEAVISAKGLEGGGIYPLAPALRGGADLVLDLSPDLPVDALTARLAKPRGKQSLSNHLRRVLKWPPQVQALVMEWGRPLPSDPAALARRLKALRALHQGLRPLDQAISTAGGVTWGALDEGLMLWSRPGVFCAGEMIDWDAPTGGYLVTACLATGLWAGRHAAKYAFSVLDKP
jgi:predicted flavoprotein YhiN